MVALGWAKKKKKKSKKKKSKKKKGASKKANLLDEIQAQYTQPPEELFADVADRMVTCHIRLLNWDYLDFDLPVREDTKLYIIAQKIIERHGGSIENLELWRDQMKPHLQLTDLNKTLREVFEFTEVKANPDEEEEPDENAQDENGTPAGDETPVSELENKLEEPETPAPEDEEAKPKKKKKKGKKKKSKRKKSKKKSKKKTKKKKKKEEPVIELPKKKEVMYECVLYYDFQQFDTTCPLLLSEPKLQNYLSQQDYKRGKTTKSVF
jgi:chemotaxis protein histidine kinase CheA